MLSPTHRIIEALLFSAREPLTTEQACLALQETVDLGILVNELNEHYDQSQSPVWIQSVAEGYRLMTRPEFDPYVRRLFQSRGRVKLSASALESLAIIAYKQPVTRIDIDAIRGVDSGATLRTLIEKNLVAARGRQDGPGRPLLYCTTPHFLEYFGLNTIRDLPGIKEIEALFSDSAEQSEPQQDASE